MHAVLAGREHHAAAGNSLDAFGEAGIARLDHHVQSFFISHCVFHEPPLRFRRSRLVIDVTTAGPDAWAPVLNGIETPKKPWALRSILDAQRRRCGLFRQ